MSNVEHYFENLLFHDHDIKGEPNKNVLSKEVQDAVEQCANYIKYTYKSEEMTWKTGKPKKHGKYLVTRTIFGKYTTISIAIYGKMDDLEETKKVCWYDHDSDYGDYEVDNVIAWMELPEPFEKKEE